MIRRIKGLVSLIVALIMIATVVNATDIYNIRYNIDTSTVTISGKTGKTEDTVTLEVLQPNVKTEDLKNIDISKINQYIYRIDETQPDNDDLFNFEFGMKTNTGNYITRIYTDKIDESVLLYVNHTEYVNAFDDMNSATTIEESQSTTHLST